MAQYPMIFLMGPTAIGKTAAAIALALRVNGEIINVDSGQVYRAMDIGTAKPTPAEMAHVPHHLVSIVEPEDPYSAARFCDDAVAAIHSIRQRGRTPVLAGGTMLYFNALEQGLAPLPDADTSMRAALEAEAREIGWPAMHAQLRNVDATSADRIHPNDPQRIQRALEVYRLTGTSLTAWQAQTTSALPEKAMKFALMPAERAWLHARIEQRFNAMLQDGFLDEMRSLRQRPDLHTELPSMRSVGYRQAWAHLEGELEYSEFVFKGVVASRQLAKRQMTWVRGMQNVHALLCDDATTPDSQAETVLRLVTSANSLGTQK